MFPKALTPLHIKTLIAVESSFRSKARPKTSSSVGVRWFGHKFYLMRNHKDKTLKTVIRNYQLKDKAGDDYAKKVLDLYKSSQ